MTSTVHSPAHTPDEPRRRAGATRRGFLGYVVGGYDAGRRRRPRASGDAGRAPRVPCRPAGRRGLRPRGPRRPTPRARPRNLITITVNPDGTASFALPALGGRPGHHHLDRDDHRRGARPARSRRCTSPCAGPSRAAVQPAHRRLEHHRRRPTRRSGWPPPIAKGALLDAAAIELGSAVALLTSKDGVITGARRLARRRTASWPPRPRSRDHARRSTVDAQGPLGASRSSASRHNRVDAHDTVTGKKKFTMDLKVPDALPTMVCRPPTLNGTPKRCSNQAAVAGDARRHRRRGGRHRRRRARRDLRPVHRRRSARCGSTGSPGSVEGESDADDPRRAASKAELPLGRARGAGRWPRPSSAASPSCSAATPRSSPTPRSPTSAPTAPRSGPALKAPIVAQADDRRRRSACRRTR